MAANGYVRQVAKGYENLSSGIKSLSIQGYLSAPLSSEIEKGRGVFLNGGHSAMSRFFVTIIDKTDSTRVCHANLPVTTIANIQTKLKGLVFASVMGVSKPTTIYKSKAKHFSDQKYGNEWVSYMLEMSYNDGIVTITIKNALCPLKGDGKFQIPEWDKRRNETKVSINFPLDEIQGMIESAYEVKRDFQTTHYSSLEKTMLSLDI